MRLLLTAISFLLVTASLGQDKHFLQNVTVEHLHGKTWKVVATIAIDSGYYVCGVDQPGSDKPWTCECPRADMTVDAQSIYIKHAGETRSRGKYKWEKYIVELKPDTIKRKNGSYDLRAKYKHVQDYRYYNKIVIEREFELGENKKTAVSGEIQFSIADGSNDTKQERVPYSVYVEPKQKKKPAPAYEAATGD